ncbi:MAG: hypothetical protein WCX73_01525 [Candidatus Pacearchaeota archaeon]|jgi:hypothetical protein
MDYSKQRGNVDQIDSKVRGLNNQREKALERITEELTKHQKRKCSVEDFTTVCFKRWDKEITQPYKDLQELVNENKGEYIMVLTQTTEPVELIKHGFNSSEFMPEEGLIDEPNFTKTKSKIKIGRLTGNLRFDLINKNIIFPTRKHIISEIESDNKDIFYNELTQDSIAKGNISYKCFDLIHLYQKACAHQFNMYSFSFSGNIKNESMIMISEGHIKQFFQQNMDNVGNYEKIMNNLSKKK